MRQAAKDSGSKKAVSAYLTPVKRGLKQFDFDYWGWWTHAVKSLNISPSEAWKLDYSELCALSDKKEQANQDMSLMLQFERKRNGAPSHIIGGLFNGN